MNIMELFRGATPAPAAATPPTGVNQPGAPLPATAASQQTDNNGVVPAAAAATPNTGTVSPLDAFKDVWQTDPNTPNPADASGPIFDKVDPNSLMQSAGKIDFAKVATPEQMAAISQGGEAAMKANLEVMNRVAQTVYAQSAFAATKIVDQAVAKIQENFDARLPSMVRKLSVNEGLQAENPLLSNPALTPLVSALNEQLVRKNPNASATEIQTQITDYFAALGQAFQPKVPETPAAKKAKQAEDWSAFFE